MIDPIVATQMTPAHEALFETLLRRRPAGRALVLGLCGAQGSGKSTLAHAFRHWLEARPGLSAAVLSLDDLYLSGAVRQDLARRVHPLLRTRGVPGTHDVAAGVALIERLTSAHATDVTRMPRFDKALDEPRPTAKQEAFRGRADVVIFEGWCVGARPQTERALIEPLNALERDHDIDGRWRRWVNDQLASGYASLFGKVDALVLLKAPSFDKVFGWRREQEQALAERLLAHGCRNMTRTMDDAALRRFIMHYERLTRHILTEMPRRADAVVELDADRRIVALRRRRGVAATGEDDAFDAP